MNFVCDQCKQKYHVADEKIRGRAVTRFRCKKCDNVIELRGDAVQDATSIDAPSSQRPAAPAAHAARAAAPSPSAIPAPSAMPPSAAPRQSRVRAPTSVGVAFNAGMAASAAKTAPSAQRSPSTSAILDASETGWYAGIRDLPVGPLTRKELAGRVQSGDVTADTLVWREGLDDWRPLRNVAELGDVLRSGAQKMSGSLLDEMGRRPAPAAPERKPATVVPLRQAPAPAAPAASHPAVGAEDDEATRVTGLDPAIAALLPKNFAARPAETPAAPVAKPAPPRAPAARAPAAPARPAPAPVAKPAPPPPPATHDRAAALADVVVGAPAAPLLSVPAMSIAPMESAPAPSPVSVPEVSISSVPPVSDVPSALGGLHDDLPPDLFARKPLPQSPAPTLESFGLPPSGPSGAPFAPVAPAAPVAAMPSAVAAAAFAAPPPPRAGMSVGVVVLMAGILVIGVFGGVLLAGRINNHPAPPTPVAPAPAAAVIAAPEPAQAPAPAPVPAPVANPEPAPTTDPAVAEADPTPGSPRPRAPRRVGGREGSAAPTPSAAELAQLRQMATETGPTGGPVSASTTTARAPASATAENNPQQTGAARANRASRLFGESRVAHTCWQNLLRMNPALHDTSVRIRLSVSAQGRVSLGGVTNSPDPRFDTCLRNGVGRIQPVGAGEALDTEVSVNLAVGGG